MSNRQQIRKIERDVKKPGARIIPINNKLDTGPKPGHPSLMEKRNAFICAKCNHLTLTVHIHEGTIPMFLLCPNGTCEGMALSFAYRLPPCLMITDERFGGVILPEYEWYKPTDIELNMLPMIEQKMVRGGGLRFRKRTDAKPLMYEIIPQ